MGAFLVLVILLLVAVFIVIGIYNSLVRIRQQVRNAWSQIDVQLKRRYDLIPNLVETVQGYAAHERGVFERVAEARNLAIAATGVAKQAQAEITLDGALRRLFAVAEAYPDLKANQNFRGLQEELSGTENRIAFARQHYNDIVATYNTNRLSFPANLFAEAFGFGPAEFFEITTPEERTPPQVKF